MIRKAIYYICDPPEDFDVRQASGILFIGVNYGYGDITRLKHLGCMLIDRFEGLIPVIEIITEVI